MHSSILTQTYPRITTYFNYFALFLSSRAFPDDFLRIFKKSLDILAFSCIITSMANLIPFSYFNQQPGLGSFYFLDEATIARVAISYIGSFPLVKRFCDVSNNETIKAISDLGFTQVLGLEEFNKESKEYDGSVVGYIHPTEKVFISIFFTLTSSAIISNCLCIPR